MESLPFEIFKTCLGWSRSTCSSLSLGSGCWWCPELASIPSLSESLVSTTNFLCQSHVIEKMNWTFFFSTCGSWCHQSFFTAVCCGDLWSAIWMQAALTKLTWTNVYLQQSTGNCSCRLLVIYSSVAQASCGLTVFGHLLMSEVNTRVSSNFLKAKLYLQKRSLYPSHCYGQI